MKIKTSGLMGKYLDWAVAECEGLEIDTETKSVGVPVWLKDALTDENEVVINYAPSTHWKQGGLIIDRERINTWFELGNWWAVRASTPEWNRNPEGHGKTLLLAAMRCYVASKLGDEVDIPEELLG